MAAEFFLLTVRTRPDEATFVFVTLKNTTELQCYQCHNSIQCSYLPNINKVKKEQISSKSKAVALMQRECCSVY